VCVQVINRRERKPPAIYLADKKLLFWLSNPAAADSNGDDISIRLEGRLECAGLESHITA
jgi:hypothetical protein